MPDFDPAAGRDERKTVDQEGEASALAERGGLLPQRLIPARGRDDEGGCHAGPEPASIDHASQQKTVYQEEGMPAS
jgi:hypothetical protein